MLIAQQSFFSNIDEISKQGAITKFKKKLSALSLYQNQGKCKIQI